MKTNLLLLLILVSTLFTDCTNNDKKELDKTTKETETGFKYKTEKFADLTILRYKIPGFDELSLKEKELVYYLYEAALAGKDILWDQRFKHNLCIKRTLESIVNTYNGDKTTEEWKAFMVYTKRVWFSNGIHHHYSTNKLTPEFTPEYFKQLITNSDENQFPLQEGETIDQLIDKLSPILFDPEIAKKGVNKDSGVDLVAASANNFYEGVSQKEVEAYYSSITDKNDPHPISYGLNSKVVKVGSKVEEVVWKMDGMYGEAIKEIVSWLEKATTVAENDKQKLALQKLIAFYRSGSLKDFDDYSIAWVNDIDSKIDVVNGFIESYGDPLGQKASFEALVNIKDMEATKRIAAISNEAQWFEDNSPIMDEHKKSNVTGISAKVITVVVESGATSPTSPIGINLPNADWIRKEHGSKSVNLGNIVYAYDEASKDGGSLEEFCYTQEEIENAKRYASLCDNLHTDLHEVIGHASGQVNEGIGTPQETLKNYSSTLEEARADLVALYYLLDKKMIEIGVMESLEVGKAGYDDYIRNGMMLQLKRIKPGDQIEEDHMRNRQLVAAWCYEKGKADNVIEKKTKEGKTYFVINDYPKLQELFGQLMREIQRIKSEGDYEAGKALVENYGVKVDATLHAEVLERYKKLDIAPYSGFINPRLIPVYQGDTLVDVKVEYPDDFTSQMLEYAKKYSFLPTYN